MEADDKILVTWGTRAGCTAEVAHAVAETLRAGGATVDAVPLRQVETLDGYRAIVLGTAVRAGQVMGEAKRFVQRHSATLRARPFALFLTCMTLMEDSPANRETVAAYLAPLRALAPAVSEGLFAGRMDYAKLGVFARIAVKNMVKVPEGDHRDWEAIRAWSEALLPKLA